MDQNRLSQAIYDKYIRPTKRKAGKYIGAEFELPVLNKDHQPVEEHVIFSMSEAFCRKFGFEIVSEDAEGHANSMADPVTGDDLSFDCSYSNLELSMGKVLSIGELEERFARYYHFIQCYLQNYNYSLTGMGINPFFDINYNQPVPNERYRMLFHYLHTYKRYEKEGRLFHNHPDFGTFTSASQVQLDVDYENVLDVINTFGRLEPYKARLFANSWLPDTPDLLCSRNMLWEKGMQGYNPHNIGMFECEFDSIEELISYIKSTSMYCTMRDGHYIDFKPVRVRDYFGMDKVRGEYFDGESYQEICFKPELSDLEYLRTFKFEDLTFRGTIEFRSCCCQPVSDSMTVAAFHVGLMERLEELKQILKEDQVIYHMGYTAAELQKILSERQLPSFVDSESFRMQMMKILDLAAAGLADRGYGESHFLDPLYRRAEDMSNPSEEMIRGLESGMPVEYFIEKYAELPFRGCCVRP